MKSVNKVILIGHLAADPEVRYTANGTAAVNFRMATNENWTSKEGSKEERTEWHRVVAWGKLGEICAEYLKKGRQVYLEGKLRTNSWETKEGEKRYSTEITATDIVFLGGKGGSDVVSQKGSSASGTASESAGFDPGPAPSSSVADDDIPF